MTLFVLIHTLPDQACPIYYATGFILSANLISGPSYSNYELTYRDNFNVDYVVKLNPRWRLEADCALLATDWFILEDCHAYIGGVEVISGIFYELRYNINEEGFHIFIQSGGGAGTEYPFDFAAVPGDYWLINL